MQDFLSRLCAAVLTTQGGDGSARALLGRAMADTLVVAAAGFDQPVVRSALAAYRGSGATSWSGEDCASDEACVFVNAVAAHALDFDDVYLDSSVHPSAVIVPAVASGAMGADADVIAALAAGLIAARAVAARIGSDHYARGWHATGTIGAFAATAAVARLVRLTPGQLRHAFALAAAQSAGLQANFGSQAKPCQAGFAAVAGVRAVRLASAGITGAHDVFADGYASLYGDATGAVSDDAFALQPQGLAVKLYPSCYAANRLIGVALDARAALGPIFGSEDVQVRLVAPAGSLQVLRFDVPRSGTEAKFSARWNLAVALLRGAPAIEDFEDSAVGANDIGACLARIAIHEDAAQPSGGDIRHGSVLLEVSRAGERIGGFTRCAIPGSPDDPVTATQLRDKARRCLQRFATGFARPFPARERWRAIPEVARWLAD